jgi:hypothetical protein
MPAEPHPDRVATTLAERDVLLRDPTRTATQWLQPGPGSADARVDLRLLRHAATRAVELRGTDTARAHIADLDTPDLLTGTVQDGTARGLMARLEEAISLCEPPPDRDTDRDLDAAAQDDPRTQHFSAKDLRRTREILVASAGARIRFSRRTGILLVDRAREIHEEHCIQFEDRSDQGCLDGFEPKEGERARLFSPAFLKPTSLYQGPIADRLVLTGRLGRGPRGFPCRMTLVGRKEEPGIRMRVWIDNRHLDHRMRIRFVGLRDASYIAHRGTPRFELIRYQERTFLAATLLRACGRLRVGDTLVDTPAAQLLGPIEHEFGLGVEL